MKPIRTFTVVPVLPPALERLRDLAYNFRWTWSHDVISLFRRLDDELWEATGHNPVLLLGRIDQARLESAAVDEGYLAHLRRAAERLDAYLVSQSTWFDRTHGSRAPGAGQLVAYFSAEFGLTESLSIFAGGLGILAGDLLKSASDLGVPLVGVSLLYQEGYFRQSLNDAGWQQEAYEDNDFFTLPLALERRTDDTPLTVEVAYPGRGVVAQVWRAQVGRVPLYLLDTNVPVNQPADREITRQLYGGDLEMRLKQEIMLGIGGCRALGALGLTPVVYHMNEGHSAFLALELVRGLMQAHGLGFEEAREAASAGLVFTTHTPVPAGHDRFPPALMDRYFGDDAGSLNLLRNELLTLGREDPANSAEPFAMTVLALRLAAHSNAVSRLHGQVTRRMWQGLWPGVPVEEIPISHVTNGAHYRSWISREMDQLYDRYLGPRWREEPADRAVWERVERIPAEELWHTHEQRRERLVAFARRRLRAHLKRRGAPDAALEAADAVLNPSALTIGFARRFAAYKRATLLARDPDRLARLLGDPARPVQVIFAGKAHPQDDPGKELIQQIARLSREPRFAGRLLFLEDYDMAVARSMVQGCDVWLNTPRRPEEASGTSGMKAVANGALHLSTLDGWWDEAWQEPALGSEGQGWAIGRGEVYTDLTLQDRVEADALYDLLERDVVPAFYDRGPDGVPRRWIARMKASIAALCPVFNTHRVLREYAERFYLPAAARVRRLTADGMAAARAFAAWKGRVAAGWPQVRITAVDADVPATLRVGDALSVRARVRLDALTPEDVAVELYLGRAAATGEIVGAEAIPMQLAGPGAAGEYLFEATAVPCRTSGFHGYTVRVRPAHPELSTPFLPGLIAWAGGS